MKKNIGLLLASMLAVSTSSTDSMFGPVKRKLSDEERAEQRKARKVAICRSNFDYDMIEDYNRIQAKTSQLSRNQRDKICKKIKMLHANGYLTEHELKLLNLD